MIMAVDDESRHSDVNHDVSLSLTILRYSHRLFG